MIAVSGLSIRTGSRFLLEDISLVPSSMTAGNSGRSAGRRGRRCIRFFRSCFLLRI